MLRNQRVPNHDRESFPNNGAVVPHFHQPLFEKGDARDGIEWIPQKGVLSDIFSGQRYLDLPNYYWLNYNTYIYMYYIYMYYIYIYICVLYIYICILYMYYIIYICIILYIYVLYYIYIHPLENNSDHKAICWILTPSFQWRKTVGSQHIPSRVCSLYSII